MYSSKMCFSHDFRIVRIYNCFTCTFRSQRDIYIYLDLLIRCKLHRMDGNMTRKPVPKGNRSGEGTKSRCREIVRP